MQGSAKHYQIGLYEYEGQGPLLPSKGVSRHGGSMAPPSSVTHRYSASYFMSTQVANHQSKFFVPQYRDRPPPSLASSPAYSSSASSCHSFGSPLIQPYSYHRGHQPLADSPLPIPLLTPQLAAPPGLARPRPPVQPNQVQYRQPVAPLARTFSALPPVRISGRSRHSLGVNPYPYPLLIPAARLRKKKYISSVQLFHLPSSMHPYPTAKYTSGSPLLSTSSSSTASTSIPSSPSSFGTSVCPQSPLVWHARSKFKYQSYSRTSIPAENTNILVGAKPTVFTGVVTGGEVVRGGVRTSRSMML